MMCAAAKLARRVGLQASFVNIQSEYQLASDEWVGGLLIGRRYPVRQYATQTIRSCSLCALTLESPLTAVPARRPKTSFALTASRPTEATARSGPEALHQARLVSPNQKTCRRQDFQHLDELTTDHLVRRSDSDSHPQLG